MNKILPIIMNSQFERIAVIDDYISFIWTTRYYDCGDFELVVNANVNNLTLFMKDYFVVRDDDENVGIIEDIMIERTEEGQEYFIVKGRFLSSILGRRIIAEQTTVTGKISDCITTLINENVISPPPSVVGRKIANFIIQSYEISTTMEAQYTGKNLLDTIASLAKTYGFGYKVTLNDDNQFVFQLYEGIDRTYDQSENTWVVFSDQYDNLLSSVYEESYQKVVTAVLVAGEGEGISRDRVWVKDDPASEGLARHEIYYDQRNIRSNDGAISHDEYYNLLREAGKEKLTAYTTSFVGEVYFDNIVYKQDINIGDLCVIENKKWGLHLNARLVEVIESVDETGQYNITPTFGV